MHEDILAELVEPGTLRAGVNMGNMLLVTGETADGDPDGISPDMARLIAERLGVEVKLVPYARPGDVADAAERNEWDIGLIAIEPKRAEVIHFCQAYVEIPATYLVPAGSPLQSIEDVDKPGIKIAVSDRAAYDLYLTRTLKHATLHRANGLPAAFELFRDGNGEYDALAGLASALMDNALEMPGSRVLPGAYTAVRQAIGTRPAATKLHAFVQEVLTEVKGNGVVKGLIDKHGVTGKLQVATD